MSKRLHNVKTILYGSVPYFLYSLFNPGSPRIKYYKYFNDHGYTRYPYTYAEKYLHMYDSLAVHEDTGKGLRYVVHSGDKKLYFPANFTADKIKKLYTALIIEQDPESPHHYVDSVEEFRGKTLLDIGAAEGLIALNAIEAVDFVYLFECEPGWIDALQATFEPWEEKVRIINKYISDHNDESNLTLDSFFADKPKDNLFLKMDVEGEERNVLAGGKGLFAGAGSIDFAICTYHRKDDLKVISRFLDEYNCVYKVREGLIYTGHSLRSCLIRGCKP